MEEPFFLNMDLLKKDYGINWFLGAMNGKPLKIRGLKIDFY
jgi:hypothetical protein